MNQAWYLQRKGTNRRRLAIPGFPCVLGRGPDCDLQLDDERISRHHARLVERDGRIRIEDLGSTNGTFVDCQRIEQATELSPTRRLHLADHEFALVLDAPSGATLVGPAARAPRRDQTRVGFTGDSQGFPLQSPAFYELLNQELIEVRYWPVESPAGAPFAEHLVCASRHTALEADAARLFEIAVELGEEARLGRMLREQALRVADEAGLGPRLLVPVNTVEDPEPDAVVRGLQALAEKYRHLELIAVLAGRGMQPAAWLDALAASGARPIRAALRAADIDAAACRDLDPAPHFLLGDLQALSGFDAEALHARATRIIALGITDDAPRAAARELGADFVSACPDSG